MKKFLSLLTGFLLVFVVMEIGNATTITVDDNITDGTYMISGTSLTGSFNIVPELLPENQYNLPYEVQSGHYTFTFEDDIDRSYSHTITSEDKYYYQDFLLSYYQRESNRYYEDEYEEVMANVEGQSNYANTTWYKTTIPGLRTYNGQYGWSSLSSYTQYYDIEKGYHGQMSITYELGVDQLLSLSGDGVLAFILSSVSGDMTYTGGSLTVELNENPVTSPVPEPTTMVLFGLGLLGIAGVSRKKK